MEPRIQIVALLGSGIVLIGVLDLVRRRKLLERYALLWLFSATILLALAAWAGLLQKIADTVGIRYAPSALFVIAFGFILFLLLHFSIAVSRLTDQSKVLAQRLALLEERTRQDGVGDSPQLGGAAGEPERDPGYADGEDESAAVLSRAGRR
jgi:hypothetical protein